MGLTPFNKRTGEFEFFVNKQAKNVLLNKFYVKGEVKKDDQTVMKALLTTNDKPYKMSLYLPALLNKIYRNMNEYLMTVADGNWIEPKITWQGRLPNNKQEAEAFFLKNNLNADVKTSKRSFNAGLSWKMDKPDFDFSTPWNCKMDFNIAGEGPNWGTYSISRDVTAA